MPNLKWSFSDSWTQLFEGGWGREQVVYDLPQSHDIAGAQEHLEKGAIQELHWHRLAEWGFVYKGRILVSVVDEQGNHQVQELNYGDVWYFPKGVAHTLQGLDDANEYLILLDGADVNKAGTIFHLDDWVAHTPKDILAKNFGVPESTFDKIPQKHPYILAGTVDQTNVTGAPVPMATGDSTYVYRTFQHAPEKIGGNGGEVHKIDSTNFPIAKTIAATHIRLKPGGLRELHWHPNAEEWIYFHQGTAKGTAFIGQSTARTYDFRAGDVAVFPDNAGHYIENTGKEDLIFFEFFKADRVVDISLSQWLALTPHSIVSQVLKVPLEFVQELKKSKQVLV
ncbi:hypothetical protein XA68_10662 [Ophiocordyceps unilateralis]|uniref:Cupin type-1 domain-containing protein n=1 Tax=Ophiocordyceps unilateralis TaxID=268505 RepID=A0A2A9PIG6_OPHUN|nr:hypothetical protein XA68_10662 [Ophiocordyceps unilateralis]